MSILLCLSCMKQELNQQVFVEWVSSVRGMQRVTNSSWVTRKAPWKRWGLNWILRLLFSSVCQNGSSEVTSPSWREGLLSDPSVHSIHSPSQTWLSWPTAQWGPGFLESLCLCCVSPVKNTLINLTINLISLTCKTKCENYCCLSLSQHSVWPVCII